MKILAIETSCDETGISVLEQKNGEKTLILKGNALASQIELHAQYGGVFPAMAKRAHAEKIVPLTKESLQQAGLLIAYLSTQQSTLGTGCKETILSICTHEDEMVTMLVDFFNAYEKPDLDYIAVTVGPGLEPALWVGINIAKVLSVVWNIPVIPVNHMEGHVVTAAVTETVDGENEENKLYSFNDLEFPLLALLVSGGHTELVVTQSYGEYEKIGQTRDDAIGEAFDKVARMLGLPYPGGPAVSKLAKTFRNLLAEHSTDEPLRTFDMPRPMLHSQDYDFSFSGLKTAMLYAIRDLTNDNTRELTDDEKMALACAFEDAAIEVLTKKAIKAAEEFGTQTIVVGGGVSGNTYLKEQLAQYAAKKLPGVTVLFPEPWLATDNAVMIGLAAFARVQNGSMATQDALTLKANGNLSIATE
jgi:N6-L-threonylcarbamoyladenine synthase